MSKPIRITDQSEEIGTVVDDALYDSEMYKGFIKRLIRDCFVRKLVKSNVNTNLMSIQL